MKKLLIPAVVFSLITASLPCLASPGSPMSKLPPGHPKETSPAAAPQQDQLPDWSGKVVQTMDSGGYSYVYLEQKNGEKVWLAIPQQNVKTGASMTFPHGSEMRNFASATLKRTFDVIYFTSGSTGGDVAKEAHTGSGGEKSPGSKGATAAKTEKIKVEKATGKGACTVEEAHRNGASFNTKKVVVRGKVVKVSAGIMGKNWVHLQDGTGSQAKGTHNLVFTSQALPVVGETVTASGTLAKDKDFGMGYRYDVIVEEASFKK